MSHWFKSFLGKNCKRICSCSFLNIHFCWFNVTVNENLSGFRLLLDKMNTLNTSALSLGNILHSVTFYRPIIVSYSLSTHWWSVFDWSWCWNSYLCVFYLSIACELPGKSPASIPPGRPHRRTAWLATGGPPGAGRWLTEAALQSKQRPLRILLRSWRPIRQEWLLHLFLEGERRECGQRHVMSCQCVSL